MSLTVEKFKSTYFYKTELVQLCRKYGLPTYGTKAELNTYILKYLSGVPSSDIKPARSLIHQKALTADKIKLDTPLVGSGFKFNSGSRQFFCNYFGTTHFSFTKQMAALMRKAERENDTEITVGDLIEFLNRGEKQKVINSPEESTYQWNNFVKDFFSDPVTAKYTNKMAVAAILWNKVKLSDDPKVYSYQLLSQYASSLENIKDGNSQS